MPDKKLTDNEIKKALECLHKKILHSKFAEEVTEAEIMGLIETLDYINRLEAENEQLRDYNENLQTANTALSNEILEAKAEAYKECIEKVKEHSNKTELVCSGALVRTDYTITKESLDNLLKELVGDK